MKDLVGKEAEWELIQNHGVKDTESNDTYSLVELLQKMVLKFSLSKLQDIALNLRYTTVNTDNALRGWFTPTNSFSSKR